MNTELMNMGVGLNDNEFIELNRESIAKLLVSRQPEGTGRGACRRRVPRWPFLGPVQIWTKTRDGEEIEIDATCHDLNEHGMGMFCDCPFEPGLRLPIAIHQPEATYHGEAVVRHCAPSGTEYFIGIEFLEKNAT